MCWSQCLMLGEGHWWQQESWRRERVRSADFRNGHRNQSQNFEHYISEWPFQSVVSLFLACFNQHIVVKQRTVCSTCSSSAWILVSMPVSRNWVSSAYTTTLQWGRCRCRSMMKIKKCARPRIKPCTTPCVTARATAEPLRNGLHRYIGLQLYIV